MKHGWLINMSRSVNDCNTKLFEKIKLKSDQIIDDGKKRYISITENTGKDFFLHSSLLSTIKPIIGFDFALFSYQSDYYFFFVGNNNPQFFYNGLSEVKVSEGIFLSLISELNLPLLRNVSETEVKDYYEYYDDEYTGHDFDGLLKLFSPFCVYKINLLANDDFNIILNKLAIDYFCYNSEATLLPFSDECKEYYLLLTHSIGNIIPIENILRSVNASTWVYCYLDLYRCIENLYNIGKIYKHFDSFKNDINFTDFYNKLAVTLNRRADEGEALRVLISLIDSNKTQYIQSLLDGSEKEDKFIYKLRNNIVHHRSDTKIVKFNDEEWDRIIIFLILTIDFLYSKFSQVVI